MSHGNEDERSEKSDDSQMKPSMVMQVAEAAYRHLSTRMQKKESSEKVKSDLKTQCLASQKKLQEAQNEIDQLEVKIRLLVKNPRRKKDAMTLLRKKKLAERKADRIREKIDVFEQVINNIETLEDSIESNDVLTSASRYMNQRKAYVP